MEDPEKLEQEEKMPELEKNDTFAMWIAGVLTVGLPIGLVLVVLAGIFILVFN